MVYEVSGRILASWGMVQWLGGRMVEMDRWIVWWMLMC